jgi:hypothetical protein
VVRLPFCSRLSFFSKVVGYDASGASRNSSPKKTFAKKIRSKADVD